MSSSQAAIAGKAALPLFLPSDSALDRTRQNRLYGRLRAQDVAAPAAAQICNKADLACTATAVGAEKFILVTRPGDIR